VVIETIFQMNWYGDKFRVDAFYGPEGTGIRATPRGEYGSKPALTINQARELADMLELAGAWLEAQENS
jgi:hypothetical protein